MQPIQGSAVCRGSRQRLGGSLRQILRPVEPALIQDHAVVDSDLQRTFPVRFLPVQPLVGGVPFLDAGAGFRQLHRIGIVAELQLAQGGKILLQLVVELKHLLHRKAVPLGNGGDGLAGPGGVGALELLVAAQIALQRGNAHQRADRVHPVLQPDILGEAHHFVLFPGAVVAEHLIHVEQEFVAVLQRAQELALQIEAGGFHQLVAGGAHDGVGQLLFGHQLLLPDDRERKGGNGILRRNILLVDQAVQHGVPGLVEVAFFRDVAQRLAVIFHLQRKGEGIEEGNDPRQDRQPENGREEIGNAVKGPRHRPTVIPPGLPARRTSLRGLIPQGGGQGFGLIFQDTVREQQLIAEMRGTQGDAVRQPPGGSGEMFPRRREKAPQRPANRVEFPQQPCPDIVAAIVERTEQPVRLLGRRKRFFGPVFLLLLLLLGFLLFLLFLLFFGFLLFGFGLRLGRLPAVAAVAGLCRLFGR